MKLTEMVNSKEGKSGLSFTFFIFFYLFSYILFFLIYLASGVHGEKLDLLLPFSCLVVATVSIFLLRKKEERLTIRIFKKFNPVYLVFAFLLAVGMLLGLGFINVSFAEFLTKIGVKVPQTELDLSSFDNYVKYVLFLAVAPAVFEEVAFRGVIVSGIKENVLVASLLSALSFSLYHFSLAQFIYQFIYGFFLCVLALKSGSVIPSIVAHFLNNFIIITTTYLNFAIDLLSPIIILAGIISLSLFVFFIFFYKRKEQEKSAKINWPNFIWCSSAGLLICLVMMLGTGLG